MITEPDFDEFADDVIDPLFPEGFTLLDGTGKYQTANGTKIDEPTKVLVLLYPDDGRVREKIREIIARYRSRFDQESVGWVRTEARVCF